MFDATTTLGERVGDAFVKFSQPITDEFLEHIKDERAASTHMIGQDFHKVCSVPVAVYELWIRQGYDPYRMTAKELLRKLRADGLDAFIATNKEI